MIPRLKTVERHSLPLAINEVLSKVKALAARVMTLEKPRHQYVPFCGVANAGHLIRSGNVVTFDGFVNPGQMSGNISANTVLANIPTGYRPWVEVDGFFLKVANVWILSILVAGGAITLQNLYGIYTDPTPGSGTGYIPSDRYTRCHVTWITSDPWPA